MLTLFLFFFFLSGTQPSTIKEWFSHRSDCLDERELHTDSNVTSENFRPGRRDALRCNLTYIFYTLSMSVSMTRYITNDSSTSIIPVLLKLCQGTWGWGYCSTKNVLIRKLNLNEISVHFFLWGFGNQISWNISSQKNKPGILKVSFFLGHRYVTLVPETERQMDFYSHTRTDGLARRIEKPFKMTETFEDRTDFLFYRHVVYGKQVKVIWAGGAFEQQPLRVMLSQQTGLAFNL